MAAWTVRNTKRITVAGIEGTSMEAVELEDGEFVEPHPADLRVYNTYIFLFFWNEYRQCVSTTETKVRNDNRQQHAVTDKVRAELGAGHTYHSVKVVRAPTAAIARKAIGVKSPAEEQREYQAWLAARRQG